MHAVDNLLFLILDGLPIIYTVFMKRFQNAPYILPVCISAKSNLVFVGGLLSSLCNLLVQFIAHWLDPFTDGKSNK